MPDVIKNRPELLKESIFYYRAYDDLFECGWSDCKQYAEYYGKDVEQLWRIINRVKRG
ncbi:UNVERIFIED_ORG: putative tail assembly chaperone [Proteus phage VB_PmiS-Isfahan]|uniref:Tail assembly chaperone n=1 Tax=Proteus phage VB_PmiS-Isfahan TaxID=1969841 RepID=A0A1U9ZA84_9CAUD